MTIFEKIIARQVPAKIIWEDDDAVAFHDVNPQAPVHVLIVPKRVVPRLAEAKDEDRVLLAGAVLGDGTHDQSLTLEQGMACLRALETTGREQERTALKARVKAAERDGNMNEALRLAEELARMERV